MLLLAVTTVNVCTVHCMDSIGRIKYTFGTSGQEGNSAYQLNKPRGVVFDRHNTLFISDFINSRICAVSAEGCLIGHVDLNKYNVCTPRGITIDNDGHLLITGIEGRGFGIVKLGYSIT